MEAGEGRSPARFEDRAAQAFDVAVGLRASGADAAVTGAKLLQAGAEGQGAELVAVVGQHPLKPPSGGVQLAGNAARPRGGARRSGRWPER
ncbi:MAG TPA: hypothetical protein VJ276_08245 [Thermoanaerobaculia bacterium]|nr:hypothetical protein [Thermoanaerobaculia bacterium]